MLYQELDLVFSVVNRQKSILPGNSNLTGCGKTIGASRWKPVHPTQILQVDRACHQVKLKYRL
jgi:hypothetical protein